MAEWSFDPGLATEMAGPPERACEWALSHLTGGGSGSSVSLLQEISQVSCPEGFLYFQRIFITKQIFY